MHFSFARSRLARDPDGTTYLGGFQAMFSSRVDTKQQALIQPIQDLIFSAVNEFAEESKFDIIFDKSSELIMLFSHPDLDKSDAIIEKLGY